MASTEPTFKIKCYKRNELEEYLNAKGVSLRDNGEYLIIDNNVNSENQLVALNGNSYEVINYSDITYFEAQGNSVYSIIQNSKLITQYKLYELEEMLDTKLFMRVHKSFIVNLKQINKIIPETNSRFILQMNNSDKIYVTRTYLNGFKQYFRL